MIWERLKIAGFVLVLAAGSSAADEEQKNLFRVVGKVEKPGPRPDTVEVTYTLANTSSKRITAWDFGCMEIFQDGTDGGLTTNAIDGYRVAEMQAEGAVTESAITVNAITESKGVIEPSGRVVRSIVFDRSQLSGPYAARTCGPVVAIFEDTSFEGPAHFADGYFEHRAREAIEARTLSRKLEQQIRQGKAFSEAIESLSAQPGGRLLSGFRQVLRRGDSLSPDVVFEQLDKDYSWSLRHLPRKWQVRVEKELQ